MEYNLITNIENCYFNIPQLLYYSHIPTLVIALLLGFYVFFKNRNSTTSKSLALISVFFCLWSISDIIIWISPDSSKVMFFWSIVNLLEIAVSMTTLYFAYLFIEKKDPPFWTKSLFGLILMIFISLIPTKINLLGFNIDNCEATQGKLIIFFYAIEIFTFLCLLYYLIRKIITTPREKKKEIIYFSIGTFLFISSFSGANIVGSILALINPDSPDNWLILQYGLIGMPVFMAFLAYLIVKYKTFNIKLVGAQALIIAMVALVGAQFFFIQTNTNRILTAITLIILGIIGINLIRSVKKEVAQREKIERLAEELATANEKLKELDQLKSEFLSLATHQIRAPLTAIKGYSSMLVEGDFGVLPEKAKGSVQTIMKSCQNLIDIVENFLNISRIEQGRMIYDKTVFDVAELVKEEVNEIKPNIQNSGLTLEINIADNFSAKVNADRNKIKQVIGNVIDNAIKYTPKGSISVSVSTNGGKVKIAIKDSGVGINPAEVGKLFAKFSRTKDAHKTNVRGTGLGLYIAQKMTQAQGGDIKVSSEGLGKGSTFTIELPVVK